MPVINEMTALLSARTILFLLVYAPRVEWMHIFTRLNGQLTEKLTSLIDVCNYSSGNLDRDYFSFIITYCTTVIFADHFCHNDFPKPYCLNNPIHVSFLSFSSLLAFKTQISIFIYDYTSSNLPTPISQIFTSNNDVHSY